jgi:hypothetical protein
MTDSTRRLTRRQAFSQLRGILVGLFVESDSIRMVADDAELNSASRCWMRRLRMRAADGTRWIGCAGCWPLRV